MNTSSSQRKDPSTKESEGKANSIEEVIPRSENDNVEKDEKDENGSPVNQRPLKSDGQNQKCLGGKIFKFRAKEIEFEPGSSE